MLKIVNKAASSNKIPGPASSPYISWTSKEYYTFRVFRCFKIRCQKTINRYNHLKAGILTTVAPNFGLICQYSTTWNIIRMTESYVYCVKPERNFRQNLWSGEELWLHLNIEHQPIHKYDVPFGWQSTGSARCNLVSLELLNHGLVFHHLTFIGIQVLLPKPYDLGSNLMRLRCQYKAA